MNIEISSYEKVDRLIISRCFSAQITDEQPPSPEFALRFVHELTNIVGINVPYYEIYPPSPFVNCAVDYRGAGLRVSVMSEAPTNPKKTSVTVEEICWNSMLPLYHILRLLHIRKPMQGYKMPNDMFAWFSQKVLMVYQRANQ